VFLSWSQDAAWVRLLRDLPALPLALYCPAKDGTTFDAGADDEQFVEFLASGGLVGALEASGSIRRQGRQARIVAGTLSEALPRLLSFASAARAARIAAEARFGLLASPNPLMWSTWVDPYRFFTEVGPELHAVTYASLAASVSRVSETSTPSRSTTSTARCWTSSGCGRASTRVC
jgi:L-arabinose isomerase